MSGSIRLRAFLFAACVILAPACSTTIKTEASLGDQDGAEERAALADAVAAVAKARWPKPSSSSFADRLAGGESDERVSRDDARDAYLDVLRNANDAETALMADAQAHLAAAEVLKTAAENACGSPNPRLADVALIEAAISDLRDTRSIYLASLDEVDGADANEKALKHAFDAMLKELGDVADTLAETAMKQSSGDFAGSEALRTAGSL